MNKEARVINLSSAAQASFNIEDINKTSLLTESELYAQSKLAITMWSKHMADSLGVSAPSIIAVNPASLLGSKMVKEAYGVVGGDLEIGVDILVRAALSDEFNDASGKYYDNDKKAFSSPHHDAVNSEKNSKLVTALDLIVNEF